MTESYAIAIYLGIALILGMSIYTTGRCHDDVVGSQQTPSQLLFASMTPKYAIAGNVGALFSVTYFTGALFIYGHIFGGWCLLGLFLALVALGPLLRRTLAAIAAESLFDTDCRRGNLLLALLAVRLSPEGFSRVTQVYALIYFALLVEELAVARLVLSAIAPDGIASIIILTTMCCLVMIYLYYGGLRAILISDYEQLKVIVAFLAVLGLYAARDMQAPHISVSLPMPLEWKDMAVGLVASAVLLLAWFGASVDLFSRLRLDRRSGADGVTARLNIVRSSIILTGVLMAVGFLFGQHLAGVITHVASPSQFTDVVTRYFTAEVSPWPLAVLVVTVFCMIFTTVDTILLALLHVGWHQDSKLFRRDKIGAIMVAAMLLSAALRVDAVSAFGVFVASLMILPLVSILRILVNAGERRLDERYLLPSLVAACLVFGLSYDSIETSFHLHYLLPTMVGLSCAVMLAAYSSQEWISRHRGKV